MPVRSMRRTGAKVRISRSAYRDARPWIASSIAGRAASNGGSSFDTYVAGKVTAVGYGGSDVGTYLQVAGVGGVALSQVAQIL